MVFIPGGTFIMGDVVDSTNSDALPLHPATVDDFYIGRYEVTFEEYDSFTNKTGNTPLTDDKYGRANRAAVYVNWYEAKAFCNYFGWRLPTENEWEYAARSGGKRMRFSGTNNIDSLDIYAINSNQNINFSYAVGSRKPNASGLYDMSGNVQEWIGQFYQYYEMPGNQHDLDESSIRILRGGSYRKGGNFTTTYWRIGALANSQFEDVGFRCAISQSELNKQGFLNGLFRFKPKSP